MSPLGRETAVGIVGAGAMGGGIAQVASTAGHQVLLYDTRAGAASRAIDGITKALNRQVEKQKLSSDDARAIVSRMRVVDAGESGRTALSAFADCGIVIEAIVEQLDVKRDLFTTLERLVSAECVLGTNTSSLSVTAIAGTCAHPERVIGIHFFNPAPVLPLVEIVPGLATSESLVHTVRALVDAWGKTTVIASDTPGFIVNRIARPFYGEALKMFEEGIADRPTIDWAMREVGGFRMGPFELMDFIGNDINFAATSAVFEGTFYDPRYLPFVTQQRLVEAGRFGKKTGRGHYDYSVDAPALQPTTDQALGKSIVARILAMLINEAADAVATGIGSPADVDLAMTKGVNYPKGLLQWGNDLGLSAVLDTLEELQREYGGARYRPSVLLKRMVREGKQFHQ
ncbi:MAG TPA: 3-hydroxyacyl-CoA dehydrogenase NAD-binding domain-containing protein [Gemmatimonadaceae bacterium]|nr:3-hydroxyacyl-CoA dehydrogenase NAD-binding domain-containing protein [Gemmatimonadaceae bacterium]